MTRIALLSILSGFALSCSSSRTFGIEWPEVAVEAPADVGALLADSVRLEPGEPAPFPGRLVSGQSLLALVERIEAQDQALADCVRGRLLDRATCSGQLDDCARAVREARKAQARAFGAGAAVGAGVAGGAVAGACGGVLPFNPDGDGGVLPFNPDGDGGVLPFNPDGDGGVLPFNPDGDGGVLPFNPDGDGGGLP